MNNFEQAQRFYQEEPTAKPEPHFNALSATRTHGMKAAMQTKRLLLLHRHAADLLEESVRLYDTGKFMEYAERQQELSEQYEKTISLISKEK